TLHSVRGGDKLGKVTGFQMGAGQHFCIATPSPIRYIWPAYEWSRCAEIAQVAVLSGRRRPAGGVLVDILAKQNTHDSLGFFFLLRVRRVGGGALRHAISALIPRGDP